MASPPVILNVGFEKMKIPDKSRKYWLRWFCMPPLVFVLFIGAGVITSFVSSAIGLWDYPCVGATCAFVWVLSAYAIVPEKKLIVAIAAFLGGAILAYGPLEPAWWPEGFSQPYQPTHLPLVATYVSGLIAVVIAATMEKRKKTVG